LEELLESGETAGNDWVPGFVFANTKGRWIRKIKTGKRKTKNFFNLCIRFCCKNLKIVF